MAWQTGAGLLLMAGSGIASTVGNALIRVTQERGFPCRFEMAAASAVAAGTLCTCLALQGEGLPPRDRQPWLFVRGLTVAAFFVLVLSALALGTPLGDVSALLGLGNMLSALWGRCILKERLRWSVALPALCLGSAGAVLVARPRCLFGGGVALPAGASAGYILAIGAGACQSLLFVSARKLVEVPALFQSVATYILMVPAAVGLGIFQGEILLVAEFADDTSRAGQALLWMLALSAALLVVGPLQSKGATLCPAVLSSTASMSSRVISGYAADVLFFGGALGLLPLCGAALMLLSSAMLVLAKPTPLREQARSFCEADLDDTEADVEAPKVASSPEAERFVVDALREEDVEGVLDMVCRIFSDQNSVFRRANMTSEDFRKLLGGTRAAWTKSGCSLVMRDMERDGVVVAFAVCEVLSLGYGTKSPIAEEIIASNPDSQFFFAALKMLEEQVFQKPELGVCSWLLGRTLRFNYGGTQTGYEGLGLQGRLCRRVLDVAAQQGFHRILVRTINPAMQHLFEKMGFQYLSAVNCADVAAEGVKLAPDCDEKMAFQQKVLKPMPLLDSAPLQALARVWMSARRWDTILLAGADRAASQDPEEKGSVNAR